MFFCFWLISIYLYSNSNSCRIFINITIVEMNWVRVLNFTHRIMRWSWGIFYICEKDKKLNFYCLFKVDFKVASGFANVTIGIDVESWRLSKIISLYKLQMIYSNLNWNISKKIELINWLSGANIVRRDKYGHILWRMSVRWSCPFLNHVKASKWIETYTLTSLLLQLKLL